MNYYYLFFSIVLLLSCTSNNRGDHALFVFQIVDLSKDALALHWKDQNNKKLYSFARLKQKLKREGKTLQFAMNAGMFHRDRTPVGLYVEKGVQKAAINRASGKGNFYLQPNGVLHWTKEHKAMITKTADFVEGQEVYFATQSGPMLLWEEQINPLFNPNSSSKHIRNGVGILEDGRLIFAISTRKVNFFEFAQFFQQKGATRALYLDGFVSKVYLPEQDLHFLGGNFGVMIAAWK